MEERKTLVHTIISGIDKLSIENEEKLASFSTIDYQKIYDDNELKRAFENCDVFWFRLNHKIRKEHIINSRCKYILCAATGLDHIDLDACKEEGILVISLKGESEFLKEVRATAEHTLGLLLALIRRTKNAFSHVEAGGWNRYVFQGSELYKKKVGIYGMGRLGKIVAEYYNVMGMQIFYYDNVEQKNLNPGYIQVDSPKELCEKVDILSIHLPYNEETHFTVDKNILKFLHSNSFVVNTARGGVVNEGDLLQLLKDKKIKGYATDVLYGEPDIKEHPLVYFAKEHENVIITPHIAGNTYESIEKTEEFVLDKLKKICLRNKNTNLCVE